MKLMSGAKPQAPNSISVDISIACEQACPPEDLLRQWVVAALEGTPGEVSLAIVDEAQISQLNLRFRQREGPTNVLSFPFVAPPGVPLAFLGDVVICAEVVTREAKAFGKSETAHFAHLVVHGVLHLRGFDHLTPEQAEVMERREREILARLGFQDPYSDID
jgi:probable rRNA maturation factor